LGSTLTEKILARAAGQEKVAPGDIINARLDAVIAHDISGTAAFREFEKMRVPAVFDREKIFITPDHFVPSPTLEAAAQLRDLAVFIDRYGITNWFEQGRGGICHALFPEQGLIRPGMAVVGGDSHTCTYGGVNAFATGVGSSEAAAVFATGQLWFKVPGSIRILLKGRPSRYVGGKDLVLKLISDIGVDGATYKTLEFGGTGVSSLTVSDRLSVSNMAIEAGGKAGIFPCDAATVAYMKTVRKDGFNATLPDDGASYERTLEYDLSSLESMVALPHLPSNGKAARDVVVQIDQAYLGSCTNGRVEDLRLAAEIMRGRKVHKDVRMVIVPASVKVFEQAMEEGLLTEVSKAGAFVSGPTCGACLGGHMGILAPGERCVSSTNRNFIGRMGHRDSEVYLAGPAVVAASAITGRITDPRDLEAVQ